MAQNAPGKHYRKGITFVEMVKQFPDDAAAEAWFTENRWPAGVTCPRCGSDNIHSGTKHRTMPYRCRSCRRYSVKTGTVMERSKLGLQIWLLASYLLTTGLKGQASMKLHRDLGITQKTAWHLAHRIRETWPRSPGAKFPGPVEVDETYVGGLEKNKHGDKKLKAGRGGVGKTAVVGSKDRATAGQIHAQTVSQTDAKTLQGYVGDRTEPGCKVFTDDHASYQGVPFEHKTVKHSTGQYVDGEAHTNGIEGFWVMFKRGFKGTYHKMSEKHLDRYVTEFAGRHNTRNADTMDQMTRMALGMQGKKLRYTDLIG